MSYRKEDWGYAPMDDEPLKTSVNRFKHVITEIRHDYTQSHLKWYTHYSSGPCFICNLMDLCDWLIAFLETLEIADKKGHYVVSRDKNSTDILAFSLVRRLR